VIAASVAVGQVAGETQEVVEPGRVDGGTSYTGTSEGRRTVLEAIEDAVGKAIAKAKAGTNSTLVDWTFEKFNCESGGIAGIHTATVSIRARSRRT
jgi:hypothetical protein